MLIGLSPERLASVNWVISAVLAAAVGILVATMNAAIDPTTITLLIIPAPGAALVGGLTSFGVTVGAAFAIAAAQALLQFQAATASWFPKADGAPMPGLKVALPLVVIMVVLFVRGDGSRRVRCNLRMLRRAGPPCGGIEGRDRRGRVASVLSSSGGMALAAINSLWEL